MEIDLAMTAKGVKGYFDDARNSSPTTLLRYRAPQG
jgi:hypothetical protein